MNAVEYIPLTGQCCGHEPRLHLVLQ